MICEGSGRASDIFSMIQSQMDGHQIKQNMGVVVRRTFNMSEEKAKKLISDITSALTHKNLVSTHVTILLFRLTSTVLTPTNLLSTIP